jgi:hypothetical protein
MTLTEIPTPVILFITGQTIAAAWAIIVTHFKVRQMEEQIKEIKKENALLQKQLKDISDTLIIVRNNTELLMLGKLKTNSGR